MTNEASSRDEVADQVHHAIIALQDSLTHVWTSMLAVEVVDAVPGGEVKRSDALEALREDFLRWQEAQLSLDAAFHAWTALVGAQQQDVITAREWLRAVCPDFSDSLPEMSLVTDHAIAQHMMNTFDREACMRTRRIIGLPPLPLNTSCNCLIDCPAVQLCPLFNRE